MKLTNLLFIILMTLVSTAKPAGKSVEGVTTKTELVENFKVTSYFRNNIKILEKVEPASKKLNTVFYIFLNDKKIFTYKIGPLGSEFRTSDLTRKFNKTSYSVKMAGDKSSKINRITIYSADSKTTFDSFWLKENRLIPFTNTELESWKKNHREVPLQK